MQRPHSVKLVIFRVAMSVKGMVYYIVHFVSKSLVVNIILLIEKEQVNTMIQNTVIVLCTANRFT